MIAFSLPADEKGDETALAALPKLLILQRKTDWTFGEHRPDTGLI
jgi:hypothetical protein